MGWPVLQLTYPQQNLPLEQPPAGMTLPEQVDEQVTAAKSYTVATEE